MGSRPSFSALLLMLFLPAELTYAGFERRNLGARSLGLGGALISFGEDPWSFYSNPARALKSRELGLFFVPSLYGLPEVKSAGASYLDSFAGIDVSCAVQTFGLEVYRESVVSAGASMPVFDFLFLGTNMNYNHLFIENYGSDASFSFDVGVKMFATDNFCLGISSTNLNSASLTNSNDRLPQTLAAGMAYVSESVNLAFEYFKELGYPSALRIAAEYSPLKPFTLRTGTTSGTNSFNAGLTVRFLGFEVEYGAMFHSVLGMTQSFGISLIFSGVGGTEYEGIRRYRESLRRR